MPYTLSHTAVVLPFARILARWRLLSAVLIGAMVPDFHVFVPWHLDRAVTHSLPALLTFCLPVGLACYWVFQLLIKTPLLESLPDGPYARWHVFAVPANIFGLTGWLLGVFGVLMGAITHLIWDAFTHEGARGVRMMPLLDDPIFDLGHHHLAGIRVIQDASSLLGLLVVALWLVFALRRGTAPPVNNRILPDLERGFWFSAYILAAIGLSASFTLWERLREPQSHSIFLLIVDIAIGILRGTAASLLLVSIVLRLRLRGLRGALRSAEPPP